MTLNETQPVAIVTGAGSGIGRAAVWKLVERHYRVVLVGRKEAPLRALAEEIQKKGETLVVPADVSQYPQVEAMVDKVKAAWGRIDVLVNAAGMAPSAPLATLEPERWHEILAANLSSAFYTTRAVWPVMSGNGGGGGGAIINISSRAAKDPFPGLGAYAVAKSGINMLSLVTAREGEAVGIRVVAIAPAGVDTPMYRGLMGEGNVHVEQILQPDDVAAAVVDVVEGSLRYASGDTVYLHRKPA